MPRAWSSQVTHIRQCFFDVAVGSRVPWPASKRHYRPHWHFPGNIIHFSHVGKISPYLERWYQPYAIRFKECAYGDEGRIMAGYNHTRMYRQYKNWNCWSPTVLVPWTLLGHTKVPMASFQGRRGSGVQHGAACQFRSSPELAWDGTGMHWTCGDRQKRTDLVGDGACKKFQLSRTVEFWGDIHGYSTSFRHLSCTIQCPSVILIWYVSGQVIGASLSTSTATCIVNREQERPPKNRHIQWYSVSFTLMFFPIHVNPCNWMQLI